jgi:hypothetical protein
MLRWEGNEALPVKVPSGWGCLGTGTPQPQPQPLLFSSYSNFTNLQDLQLSGSRDLVIARMALSE